MHVTAIIPARFKSTRLPGKPLAKIGNKAMIDHVYQQCKKVVGITEVHVATDDHSIFTHCINEGMSVFMTSEDHINGTSRVTEVAKQLSTDVVINVQGDEPFIETQLLEKLVQKSTSLQSIVTLICPIKEQEEWQNPNVVKTVLDHNDNALYFSRAPIPHSRDGKFPIAFRHLGVYAFPREILLSLESLPFSPLATYEKLEQLSWLQAGYSIATLFTDTAHISVDTPADLDKANQIWAQLNR